MTRTIVLTVCLFFAHPSGVGSQTPAGSHPEERAVRTDTSLALPPAGNRNPITLRLEENTARPLSTYFDRNAERFMGLERYELSRFQCAVSGAEMGFQYGLFAGAAGLASGAWDERTGWYIAGAAALAGAIFGGTAKADDPGFRVRLRWDDSDRDPRGR